MPKHRAAHGDYMNNTNNIYNSLKIPGRQDVYSGRAGRPLPQISAGISLDDGLFHEIEYGTLIRDAANIAAPQKISEPEHDEARELFTRMRNIAREQRSTHDYSRFFDRRVQQSNAIIFYKQGMFMKDFCDNYAGKVPFTQYFPYYQMMGYEQLRTYFTWRTQVRNGNITDTSPAYVFVYLYELLNNIGVESPQDGLGKLMFFWEGFKPYNTALDKYMLRWLKDYHIYYGLTQPFEAFARDNNLTEHYPRMVDTGNSFDLFSSISKYDIRKSVFFGNNSEMISGCFDFVMKRIRRDFEAAGINFDDAFFRPTRRLARWQPFKDALFYHWLKQPDRRVVLSENEIYICKNNEWTTGTTVTSEKGRQFIGFVMKQMESVLRQATKYKYKLTANTGMINDETIRRLTKAGLSIEKIVPAAVAEFHKQASKTIVTIDHTSLARIREEAHATQEALIVEDPHISAIPPVPEQNIFSDPQDSPPVSASTPWDSLKEALGEYEMNALEIVLQQGDLKAFADECGVMLEVLVDGINEKAMDCIGDNLLDEDFALYDDYKEQAEELIR